MREAIALVLCREPQNPSSFTAKRPCAWAVTSSSGCFMSEATIPEKGHGSVRLAGAVIRSSIGKFASTFQRNRQPRELALVNCAIKFFAAGNQIVAGSSARQPGHCPKLRPAARNVSGADNVKAILSVECEFSLVESFRVARHPRGVCAR